jgi:hypothetical protein
MLINLHMIFFTSLTMIFFLLVVQCFSIGRLSKYFGTVCARISVLQYSVFGLSHERNNNMAPDITSVKC